MQLTYVIYTMSIGTTMDDLKWPWINIIRIARYLCGSWVSCQCYVL